LIEQQLPAYKVVNFGMYAALGTKVMLDLSESYIREGDIVVISPEQNAQTLSAYFNAEMMWQAIDGAYHLLGNIKSENRSQMVGQFPYFAASKCRYSVLGKPKVEGIYQRSSFNEYGDIASTERGYNVMPGLYDTTMPVYFTEQTSSLEFFTLCNDYAAKLRKLGATVYYRFCPTNVLAVKEGDPDVYFDYLQERLEFPVIGTPTQSVMDAEWFYDTNFHLNASGAIVNTYHLIRDIKAVLGDSSPTKISLPEKPPILTGGIEQGDDSQAAYFEYESFGDGWRVIGVQAHAKDKDTLIVPAVYQGKPVRVIGTKAFESCNVQEIILQGNITALENFAFWECSRLSTIILKQNQPSRCQVGQYLLEGTSANIHVPKAVLDKYKVNYFWATYSLRLFPIYEE